MRRLVWPGCLLAVTLAGGSARAAVVLALDLQSLVRDARVIADVEVVDRHAVRLTSGQIITEHVALVREGIRGIEDGEELRFFTEGGIVGGVGAVVAGEPRPRVGDRILAFLEPAGAGLRFVGMSQGCLPVVEGANGAEVLPGARDAVLVVRTPRGMVRAAPAVSAPRPLAPFLREVRALVAR
jgi:hypothetical protein